VERGRAWPSPSLFHSFVLAFYTLAARGVAVRLGRRVVLRAPCDGRAAVAEPQSCGRLRPGRRGARALPVLSYPHSCAFKLHAPVRGWTKFPLSWQRSVQCARHSPHGDTQLRHSGVPWCFFPPSPWKKKASFSLALRASLSLRVCKARRRGKNVQRYVVLTASATLRALSLADCHLPSLPVK
jgi:hypothetical protein